MSRQKKKALQIAKRLRDAGQHATAKRLIEAFRLENQFADMNLDFDESLAEIDDEELTKAVRDMERFIPTAAVEPETDLEEMDFGNTGVFPKRRKR